MIVAKTEDLDRMEFAAFNHGRNYPHMRRWEMPFVLFNLRLPNTASVLDCTINPVDFSERLQSLYPHVTYRHWNPVQRGQFSPPLGVPDGAFDRVVCVNTLEHLLKEQRETLVAALARKLKPNGILVLTSDFYFDSMWGNESVLKLGVIRHDRQEVFGGWNRVAPREYAELFRRHGLRPLDGNEEEPREADPTLYLNSPPYEHACVASLFCKAAKRPRFDDSRKVVLSLLTWNMRDISLESLAAYAAEAATLRRLGHEPFIVVCDNGSTDGTQEALREAEREMDVPCALILNSENRGSSVARNQIIDFALRECGADYLIFMDGDIEIVPFSSFAMLRHMENNGHRLGCAGANSFEHTPERARAAPFLFSIAGHYIETTNLVAWTQYGMFRREVFEAGVRFDERAPFDRPGWGFEDNDLAFQMDVKGYVNHRFYGMTYLHRSVHSSLSILRREGVDAATLYAHRRQYLLDKWSSVPRINNGPLADVRRVRMPEVLPQL